jgi:O-antigen/teichoic acid export membrane protein
MGFFLLPIYTLFLTPEDFGVTNLVTGFIAVTNFVKDPLEGWTDCIKM